MNAAQTTSLVDADIMADALECALAHDALHTVQLDNHNAVVVAYRRSYGRFERATHHVAVFFRATDGGVAGARCSCARKHISSEEAALATARLLVDGCDLAPVSIPAATVAVADDFDPLAFLLAG